MGDKQKRGPINPISIRAREAPHTLKQHRRLDVPLEQYEISDEQWDLFQDIILIQIEAENIQDIHDIIRIFKRFWLLIDDTVEMSRIVNQSKLDKLIGLRDGQDDDRSGLDSEISRLEGLLGR